MTELIPSRAVLRSEQSPLVPWRNGLGRTRDLVTRTGPDGALLFQIGIAELVADAPFSDFSGLDRLFTPIGDKPVELRFDHGPWLACPPLVPVAFAGERRTELRLPHGAARAFNVIVARDMGQARVAANLVSAGSRFRRGFPHAGAVYCQAGTLRSPAGTADALGPGCLLLLPAGQVADLVAEEHATLLIVELGPAATS